MTLTKMTLKSNAASAIFLAAQMFVGSSLTAMAPSVAAAGAPAEDDASSAAALSLDNQIEKVLDDIDDRERRAVKSAARQAEIDAQTAALAKLGSEPTPEALAYGRKAAAADPLNFSLRLRVIDLLNAANLYEEADKTAAALIAERTLTPRESLKQSGSRQRALLKRVRMASDRGFYAYAQKLLKQFPALKPRPEMIQTAKVLEARIVEQQRNQDLRAELERMRALPPEEARLAVRSAVTADPKKLDLRLLLIDLLGEADLVNEAEIEADRFVADPLTASEPVKRQAAQFKKARVVLKRQAFAQSRNLIDAALAQPVIEQRYIERAQERAVEIRKQVDEREHVYLVQKQIEAIGNEPTPEALAASAALLAQEPGNIDVALHRARLFRKVPDFDQADAIYASLLAGPAVENPILMARISSYQADMRLRASILAIGDVPTRAAISQARALSAQNPQSVEAAFQLALLLRKNRAFEEAEAIYKRVLAEQGSTDPEAADRAQFNLATLYLGSNRVAEASSLLDNFRADSSSPFLTSRIGDLGNRIDQKLAPNRISGTIGVAVGYDSNVITRVDLLDQESGQLAINKAASPLQTIDLNSQYRRVIDDNGNFLAVTGNLTHTTFNSNPGGGIDRTLFDFLIGPVYALPKIDSVISGGFSYRYRLRDYNFARQSPGLLLRLDQTLSSQFSVRTEALYERVDDKLPNRDGNSYEVRYTVNYALTPRDDFSAAIRGRRDAASIDFEARSTIVGTLSYRQSHPLISSPGSWFWGTAVNYTNLAFGAPNPLFNDNGRRRKDNNFQIDASAGRDLGSDWAAALRFSYLGRDSTVPRNSQDSFRVLLSLTRRY